MLKFNRQINFDNNLQWLFIQVNNCYECHCNCLTYFLLYSAILDPPFIHVISLVLTDILVFISFTFLPLFLVTLLTGFYFSLNYLAADSLMLI
jgi:hypothetical protein